MNIRRCVAAVAILLAVSIAACGTDAASSPTSEPTPTAVASSPTPEATPTTPAPSPTPSATPAVGPLDPITVDPSAEPEAFLAALPADEVACGESAVGDRAQVAVVMSYSGSWENGFEEPVAPEDLEAVVDCLGDESVQRILIGHVVRMAGGLSSETISCMTSYATPFALVSLFALGEPVIDGTRDMMNLIFCLDASERAALETSGNDMVVEQRVGSIDGMECMANRRETDGTSVYERLMVLQSQAGYDWPSLFSDAEYLATYATSLRVAVECGGMTDEGYEGIEGASGFTATQTACMYEEAGTVFYVYSVAVAVDTSALPDLGLLLPALEVCGVSPEVLIRGVYGPPAWFDDDNGDDPWPTAEVPSLNEANLSMTKQELNCLLSHVSKEDLGRMMETGEAPANLFEGLDACELSVIQLFPKFPRQY